jgi:hypothetical protein
MKFCQKHWDTLRQKIADRGLDHLVAQGGPMATAQMADQIKTREVTRDNFDPLMAAHWAIVGNAMEMLSRAGIDPLYLLGDGRSAPDGRNDCPLCELNYLHKTGCTDPRCVLDKEAGYDWMLDRAADDSLDQARDLKLIPAAPQ